MLSLRSLRSHILNTHIFPVKFTGNILKIKSLLGNLQNNLFVYLIIQKKENFENKNRDHIILHIIRMIARIEWMLADHLFRPSSNLNIFHAIFMKYFYSGN